MRINRAVLLWASSLMLHGALLLIIASLSIYVLFGNKNAAKEVFVESGIYNKFVDALIQDNTKIQSDAVQSLPLDDPEIQTIAKQAFSPIALKRTTETVIDNLYAWLNEDTEEFTFEVNFYAEKEVFIERVSDYAANRLEKLPYCEQNEILTTVIFELQCRPIGISSEFIKKQVENDLHEASFFKEMNYTQEDLPKSNEGKNILQQYAFIPLVMQSLKKNLWIFMVVFLLASVLFVSVRRPLRKGFKSYGRDLLSNSVTLFLATLLFGFILPRYTERFSVEASKTTQVFTSLSDAYMKRFDVLIINVTLQVATIGLVILMVERFTRQSRYSDVDKKSGITTSVAKKNRGGKTIRRAYPPIQTSEGPKKRTSSKHKVPKKYRKIGLE